MDENGTFEAESESGTAANLDAVSAAIADPLQGGHQEAAGSGRARMVPYGALAHERGRRRDLQRALEQALGSQQALRDQLDQMRSVERTGIAPAIHGTSPDNQPSADAGPPDIAGEQPVTVDPAEDAYRTQILSAVRSFAAIRPDFQAAYAHARASRIGELMDLGYAREEALGITFDNEREVIASALASGSNPAQVIYEYALRRGYRSGPEAEAPGRGPSPAAAPAGLSEAEKVALAARGQAGAKSLSSAGGAPPSNLSIEALASLGDEEFAEATKGEKWRKLLRD